MSNEIILAVFSLLGGATAAKLVDMYGKRQELNFSERRAIREDERARLERLEKRVDDLLLQVSEWQAKYLAADEHARRCEGELVQLRERIEHLEARQRDET